MAIFNTTIRDLSPELLSSIFLIATHHFEDPFESILMPITISHVSSRWRDVAMYTRGLWTSIVFTFPIGRSQLSRCTTWLARSWPYPLDIFLDFRDPSWGWEEDVHRFNLKYMVPILDNLLPHVKRWRHLELLTDTWAPIFFFLYNTRNVEAAPLLQSLSLSRCNAYFASKSAIFHPAQLQVPISLFGGLALDALRYVSLVGVHVDWDRSSLRGLTSLEFKYHARGVMPSLDKFLDILSECLELRQLSIIGWGPQFEKVESEGNTQPEEIRDPVTDARRIRLQHLVQFSFGFVDVDYAVKVLSLFDFPSIQDLTLEDVSFTLNPVEYQDATPILDWLHIARTVPLKCIQSLQLYNIHAGTAVASHFFSDLINLQILGLFNVADFTLRALHPSADPCIPHPCPNLEEIECVNVDSITLGRLVQSRAMIDSILPLKSILFDSDDTLQPITHGDCIELNDDDYIVLNEDDFELNDDDFELNDDGVSLSTDSDT